MAASLGSLVIEIQGNIARLENDMAAMQTVVESHVGRINNAASTAQKNLASVGEGAKSVGRVKGVDEMVDQLDHLNFKTVAARRELLVLAHEASQGNWTKMFGSVMVLGERIDAMSLIFSKTGIAILGLVGALGGFIFLVAKGAIEADHLSKSLTLTNQSAGLTAQSFADLSRSIADSTTKTIGASRDALAALVATGAFTRQQLGAASADLMALEKLSGESAEKIAGDFAKMREGVSRWAEEHNRQWHYMSAAQYDYIRALEDSGQTEKAMLANLEILQARYATDSAEKLGIVARAWRAIKNEVSDVANAIKNLGRPETTADRIRGIESMLQGVKTDADPNSQLAKWRKTQEGELANLREMQRLEDAQARRQGIVAQQQQQAIKATDDLEKLRVQFDKQYAKQKEINELNVKFADLARGNPNSPMLKGVNVRGTDESGFSFKGGEYDKILQGINERYKDKHAAGIEKANLDALLRPLEDEVKEQNELLAQRETMLKKYHEADLISTTAYYKGLENAINEHTDKIKPLYARETQVIADYAKRASDERARIEATTKAKQTQDAASRAIQADLAKLNELTPQQAKETEAYRLEVEKLSAELAKLQGHLGDNVAQAFDRAHNKLSKQATLEGDTGTLARLEEAKRLTVAQGELNEAQHESEIILQRLKVTEDGINQDVKFGQTNELEGMNRIKAARQDAITQLQTLSDKINEVAIASGDPKMLLFATQFDQKLKDLQGSSDMLANKLQDAFGNEFAKALEGVVLHTKSLNQAIQGFAGSILNMLTQLAANSLAKELFGGLLGGSSGGSGGGAAGGLFSLLSGLFGGGRAGGGEVGSGKMYEVAENGPELLSVANRTYLMMGAQGGNVVPMAQGQGGGVSQHVNMSISVPPLTNHQTASQMGAQIAQQMQMALRRNG